MAARIRAAETQVRALEASAAEADAECERVQARSWLSPRVLEQTRNRQFSGTVDPLLMQARQRATDELMLTLAAMRRLDRRLAQARGELQALRLQRR